MRKRGEHGREICSIIRQDLLKEFIVNKSDIHIADKIKTSIFETNEFLIKMNQPKKDGRDNDKSLTFIQYAAFFGSVQIFQFLHNEEIELDLLLCLFAIHGQNSEIIHILEDSGVKPYG